MYPYFRKITVAGLVFTANRTGADDYTHVFRDFRIRVHVAYDEYSREEWAAVMTTTGGKHVLPSRFTSPRAAAKAALAYWRDEIEESDRLDAEDSDRERREFEREQTLGTRDVL